MSNVRLPPKSWAKIACPWFVYQETNPNETKECSICWENCSKYLVCSNGTEHIICPTCSEHIVENNTSVNRDTSINIKWKCPLCREDNIIGMWQYTSSSQQLKNKLNIEETNRRNQLEITRIQQNTYRTNQLDRLQQQQQQYDSILINLQRTKEIKEYRKNIIQLKNNTDVQNITNSRFKWIKTLNWKDSVVNHFKAWIMYNDTIHFKQNKHTEKSLGGQRLYDLKEQHNYETLKYSTLAPWHAFLFKNDILD